ncbi:MAG: hypothetical protein ACRD0K_10835 [Egibacteraceae bacterium]
MTGLTDPRPARTLAMHAGILADRAEISAADWRTSAGCDPLAATLALSRFTIAADHLTALAARLAALPPDPGRPDRIHLRGLAGHITAALGQMRRPDGQPAPPADLAEAAETIREAADVLLTATAPSLTPADLPDPESIRVQVSASRRQPRPPRACGPIEPARRVTDVRAIQRLARPVCARRWDVAPLGGPNDGLWARWAGQHGHQRRS